MFLHLDLDELVITLQSRDPTAQICRGGGEASAASKKYEPLGAFMPSKSGCAIIIIILCPKNPRRSVARFLGCTTSAPRLLVDRGYDLS